MEFLVRIETQLPSDLSDEAVQAIKRAEHACAREMMTSGELARIWRVPGRRAVISLYRTADATSLHQLLASLPQFPWMDIEVTTLAAHPLEDR